MVLEWLGGSKDADALMARRKYPQAIEALRQLLERHGGDVRLRMKLADALVLAGREREAAPVLLELADGASGARGVLPRACPEHGRRHLTE
jgi:Flp pilus assembly protein TadD